MNSCTYTDEKVLTALRFGAYLKADISLIYRSVLRNLKSTELIHSIVSLRNIALQYGCLKVLFDELTRRINANGMYDLEKYGFQNAYEILQIIDFYSEGYDQFEAALSCLLSRTHTKPLIESLSKVLPLVVAKLGINNAKDILAKREISFNDIQSQENWLIAVCEQPSLLTYCTNDFQDNCSLSLSYYGRLAFFLNELLCKKYISKKSIIYYLNLKVKFKKRFIGAIRRYSITLQSISKEVASVKDINVKCTEDIIFVCMLHLSIPSEEFQRFFIKNELGMSEQELAFCYSCLNIRAKDASFINRRLRDVGLSPLNIPLSSNIKDYYLNLLNNFNISRPLECDYGKVTVIMTTKNPDTSLLRLSIRSILEQTYKNIELIVIDDGSDDATLIPQALSDFKNINIHKSGKNNGTYQSRNIAIEMTTGDYIAFQDDDDISHPQRIEYQLSQMKKYNADIMTVSHIRLDEKGRFQIDLGTDVISDGPVTMIINRTVFDKVGMFKPIRSRGDVEFRSRCKRLLPSSSYIHQNLPLYYAYGSPQTLSSVFQQTQYSKLQLQRLMASMEEV